MLLNKLSVSIIVISIVQRILTRKCHKNNCKNCYYHFYECYCETCFPEADYHECTKNECIECKINPDKDYFFNCKCSKCGTSASSSSSGLSSLATIGIIFFVFIVIFGIAACIYSYFKARKILEQNNNRNNNQVNNHPNNHQVNNNQNNNQVNNNIVANVNNNNNPNDRDNRIVIDYNYINSNENIVNPINKEITLDIILKDKNYLGPKLCKEEYQKFNDFCTICLEKFKNDLDTISLTPCFHLFHHDCIKDFFKKSKDAKCPNCKMDIIKYYSKQI